jgi:metallo-beta-lactamase class B
MQSNPNTYTLSLCLWLLVTSFAFPAWAIADQQAWAEHCKPWDDWDKPAPPFKIYGNTYYVGTCGISSILVAGDNGHILIDGGTELGAKIVAANIETLGFAMGDVKLLLHSHEHFDHVAGLAYLKKLSGAEVIASAIAKPVLETGVVNAEDPQAGMHDPFPQVGVDRIVADGQTIELGKTAITAVSTPGHAPGALSWSWEACEQDACQTVVYADSLSPVSGKSYQFSQHPEYLSSYKRGLQSVAALKCDVLLTPHPSASKMVERISAGTLMGSMSCEEYADSVLARLEDRLRKELERPK